MTEELVLRKLRKSSVKVFKHRYEQAHNTVMRKWKVEEIEPVGLVKTMIW